MSTKQAKTGRTKEAKARARRVFEQKRREAGEVKKTVRLTKETWEALQRLQAEDGSISTSIQIAILALDMKRRAKTATS